MTNGICRKSNKDTWFLLLRLQLKYKGNGWSQMTCNNHLENDLMVENNDHHGQSSWGYFCYFLAEKSHSYDLLPTWEQRIPPAKPR
jgi:hypothetical protein